MVVCGLTNGGDTNGSGHTSKSKVLQHDLAAKSDTVTKQSGLRFQRDGMNKENTGD